MKTCQKETSHNSVFVFFSFFYSGSRYICFLLRSGYVHIELGDTEFPYKCWVVGLDPRSHQSIKAGRVA